MQKKQKKYIFFYFLIFTIKNDKNIITENLE